MQVRISRSAWCPALGERAEVHAARPTQRRTIMNRLTYEELIEDLRHKQVVAMTCSAAFTGTIHGRRVDVYPLGFFVFDESGESYTSRPVCGDLAAVLLETL